MNVEIASSESSCRYSPPVVPVILRDAGIEHRLECGIWHRLYEIDRGTEISERLDDLRAFVRIADVHRRHAEDGLALEIVRHEWLRGRSHHASRRHFVGARVRVAAPRADDVFRAVQREEHQPGEHDRPERMQREFEFGRWAADCAGDDIQPRPRVMLSRWTRRAVRRRA
jgi:hypothetical protein